MLKFTKSHADIKNIRKNGLIYMQKKKTIQSNKLKCNEIIQSAMLKRRSLALHAIAKICNIDLKMKVVKN